MGIFLSLLFILFGLLLNICFRGWLWCCFVSVFFHLYSKIILVRAINNEHAKIFLYYTVLEMGSIQQYSEITPIYSKTAAGLHNSIMKIAALVVFHKFMHD